jgi:urate oxidase
MSVNAAHLHLCIADLAKVPPHVLDLARFVRYAHLSSVFVAEEQLSWERIRATRKGSDEEAVGNKHALGRDKMVKRFVLVEVARKGEKFCAVLRVPVAGGLRDLDLLLLIHPHTLIK